jgi:hypothetical protein
MVAAAVAAGEVVALVAVLVGEVAVALTVGDGLGLTVALRLPARSMAPMISNARTMMTVTVRLLMNWSPFDSSKDSLVGYATTSCMFTNIVVCYTGSMKLKLSRNKRWTGVILVVAAVAAGVFVWFGSKPIKPPAGWLTYKSSHSSLQFSYPADWKLASRSQSGLGQYGLERVELYGLSGFEMAFDLETRHHSLMTVSCTTARIDKNVPVSSEYELSLDTLRTISLYATDKRRRLPLACISKANSLPGNQQFTFTGSYPPTDSHISDSADTFLARSEVMTAKRIFSTVHE